jgi:phenylacetate-CoA ligase
MMRDVACDAPESQATSSVSNNVDMNDEQRGSRCRQLQAVVSSAANDCQVWRELLGARPPQFSSLAEFAERVPVVDRNDLFTRPWRELVRGGDLRRVDGTLLSSGSTGGSRAVGLLDTRARAHEAARLWAALVELFEVDRRPTLLINTLSDGVSLDLPGITCVATGARALLAVEYLAQFGASTPQLILVGEPDVLLEVLQSARSRGVLPRPGVRVVSGGEFLSEQVRMDMCTLLGIDEHTQASELPLSSFGMAEVGVHILWETPATAVLRRALAQDGARLAAVCPGNPRSLPCIMTYDPEHVFVETIGGELILTRLDRELLQPLVRYNTHERCGHVDLVQAAACLAERGLSTALPERLIWLDPRELGPCAERGCA